MMRPRLPVFTALVIVGTSGWLAAQDATSDRDRLQGKWELTELIVGGKPAPRDRYAGTRFVFAGDRLTIVPPEDAGVIAPRTFTVKLDPAKKPAAVDLTALDGDQKGTTSPGIYELKGDTLRWCQSDDPRSKDRPTAFASNDGSRLYLFTLKRRSVK
jgi:uncharacterized protein (TIGR03067 family)